MIKGASEATCETIVVVRRCDLRLTAETQRVDVWSWSLRGGPWVREKSPRSCQSSSAEQDSEFA